METLAPHPRNPKSHDEPAIGNSIGKFGYVQPILLDERTGLIAAGHGRRNALRAMKAAGQAPPDGVELREGAWFVPVVRGWSSRSDAEAMAYLAADNQLTIAGGWNNGELAQLLKDVSGEVDMTQLGFSAIDISKLLDAGSKTPEDPDEFPEPKGESWVKPGQMYKLGRHRILCASSTEKKSIDLLLGGRPAHACWTDPPWNVAYGETKVPGGWSKKHRRIENDNLGDAFPGFCSAFVGEMAYALLPGAPVYLAMSAQEWPVIHAALTKGGFHWSSTIIWAKDSLVLSRKDYHTQYEPIWYGWRDGAARLHELEDRTQSDLWQIPRPKKSDEHPTMKPVDLVKRSLANSTIRGERIFEPFSGSGTTIVACEMLERDCFAIELDPAYVQVAIERWEKMTGGRHEEVL